MRSLRYNTCSALVASDQHAHCMQRSVLTESAVPGRSTGFPCRRQYLHCMIAISIQTYMYTYTSVIQTPKLRAFQATGHTLNPVLYRILDVTVRPCSKQRLTHLDSTSHGGMVQWSFAKLEAHARNNSTGKSS